MDVIQFYCNLRVHITFSLSVKPFSIIEPSDATVLSGSVVEFVCRVGGDPAPTILWRRDDGKNSEHFQPELS